MKVPEDHFSSGNIVCQGRNSGVQKRVTISEWVFSNVRGSGAATEARLRKPFVFGFYGEFKAKCDVKSQAFCWISLWQRESGLEYLRG